MRGSLSQAGRMDISNHRLVEHILDGPALPFDASDDVSVGVAHDVKFAAARSCAAILWPSRKPGYWAARALRNPLAFSLPMRRCRFTYHSGSWRLIPILPFHFGASKSSYLFGASLCRTSCVLQAMVLRIELTVLHLPSGSL